MALPLALAGGAAASAYLNAKYHLWHDLTSHALANTPNSALKYMESMIAAKKMTTYDVFHEQATVNRPDEVFLIFEGREYTWRGFLDGVTRLGNWLMNDLGVKAKEIVAIDGGNTPEYMMLWFALDGIGAVPSFINCNLTSKSLVHCVELCESRFLICDRDVMNLVEPCAKELSDLNVQILTYGPDFPFTLPNTTPLPLSRRTCLDPADVRSLIYTSGTTGLPKAVLMMTGRELLTGHGISGYLRLKPGDRMYTCMPLYHGAAHGLCVTPSVHAGSAIVLGRKFSHKTFWPDVRASKANVIQYVGELCRYLLNGDPSPLDKAHNVHMAWGNGMRPDVWGPFRERFGIPCINELYAATDGLGSTFNRNYGPLTQNAIGLRGLLWDYYNGSNEVFVKIDIDTQEILRNKDGWAIPCKTGEPGEALHRLDPENPDAAFHGYYKNRGAGDKRKIYNVFKKGDLWFRAGDLLRRDSDGRVFFVDRLGDTFRWKSENVSTNEVSDVVGKFDQIAETNVYGVNVPHTDGRAGCAAVVLAQGVSLAQFDFQSLATHVLGQLPKYAVPIFLRVTEELAYTGTMKLQKGPLRADGIDPKKVAVSGDKLYWMPINQKTYVPFTEKDLEALETRKALL
ncbi:long-chain fatty acid transporter-like protein [Eremomyces bilateralis CBS 781.70]|uniref:Long-chain fatty acid transporter-like protein n=1 Tax=Eremomyces bilateralis CBS 781.70 TaxID=1392243 RepID=A0A6G1FQP9_9PEZI|nr:long-chain fatty acid transporter-like protein [Eremomyces bilateralis CBS 781.70]KAF1808058.1 long-chain fatty acid transporter-like protein [Eremomyces bilateralis CBS 781.70]